MKLRLPSKKFMLSSFSMLVVLAILMSVVPTVYAEGSDPLLPIPGLGRPNNNTLIRMHEKEVNWYSEQETLIKEADVLAEAFQTLIDAQVKQKKDVTILQEGLAAFYTEVAAVQAIHLTAGTTIFSLTGFKVNGDVRDRLAAGQTLLSGHATLKDAHVRLVMAMTELRRTFARWRHSRISGLQATKLAVA